MDSPVAVSPRPEHILEFYSDDDKLLDGWESLISNAVESGDAAICVATKTHAYGLAERLKLHTPKVTAASGQGRYITVDAAEALSAVTPEGKFNEARFLDLFEPVIASARPAIAGKASRAFILGEAVALMWLRGEYDSVIAWEHSWNGLAQARSLSLRCFYPIEVLSFRRDHNDCQTLCAEHSATIIPSGLPMLSGKKGNIHTDSELIQVWAQAGQLMPSEDGLRYPEWQGKYRAALLETDRGKLFKKVEVAEAAILTRLDDLGPETNNSGERQELRHARSGLQMIKQVKLGFFE